jgi:hypothetical protein
VLDKNFRLELYPFCGFWFKLYQFTNDTQDVRPSFFGGIYNSIWSENKINPILSLFCVAEKAMVAAISVTIFF